MISFGELHETTLFRYHSFLDNISAYVYNFIEVKIVKALGQLESQHTEQFLAFLFITIYHSVFFDNRSDKIQEIILSINACDKI